MLFGVLLKEQVDQEYNLCSVSKAEQMNLKTSEKQIQITSPGGIHQLEEWE